MNLSKIVSACALAVTVAGCASMQEAAKYPAQPVKVVVPYPVGNAADIFGRIVAEKLAQLWGQPVTIENRAGVTAVPGVESVTKAKPDGYTLLVYSVNFAVDVGAFTGLPYDPEKDFVPVAPIVRQPFTLVATPSLGVKNVPELVAKAKAEKLKFASLGPTTQIFFVTEHFKKQAGIPATNVSFKGIVDANAATGKGDVSFYFPPVVGALAGVREGKLVPLAVTGTKRSNLLPQVPTLAEAGVPNMEIYAWFGMWAPAGTPAGVVDRIAQDVERALAAPDVREKLAKMGAEPMSMTPSQFGRFVRGEIESSRRFNSELGIKPQAYSPPARQ